MPRVKPTPPERNQPLQITLTLGRLEGARLAEILGSVAHTLPYGNLPSRDGRLEYFTAPETEFAARLSAQLRAMSAIKEALE